MDYIFAQHRVWIQIVGGGVFITVVYGDLVANAYALV
jgi:hypothetical protein